MIPMRIPVVPKDESVVLTKLVPQMWFCLAKCAEVHRAFGSEELTVTSATDGKHSKNSLHYSGRAIDLRFWDYVQKWTETPTGWEAELDPKYYQLIRTLREELGGEYDVVIEGDHLHVEWDPV